MLTPMTMLAKAASGLAVRPCRSVHVQEHKPRRAASSAAKRAHSRGARVRSAPARTRGDAVYCHAQDPINIKYFNDLMQTRRA